MHRIDRTSLLHQRAAVVAAAILRANELRADTFDAALRWAWRAVGKKFKRLVGMRMQPVARGRKASC